MSQDNQVLAYLETGESITPFSAFEKYGVLALHSSIARLRNRGLDIACNIERGNGKNYGRYRLIPRHGR